MFLADLHVHTNVSDCSESAEDILKKAREKGITHIAFTDHDTTRLALEHVALAKAYGIQAVQAVEMSAMDPDTKVKAHILGYGYKTTHHIEKIGRETLRKRDENCLRQIAVLKQRGYRIDEEAIRQMAGECIYKQHILDYLWKTKQSGELFGDIYNLIFKNGGPCDFDIEYPDAAEVVRAIRQDGGYAVLAHPGQQNNFYLLKRLVDEGLNGIEYRHPSHTEEMMKVAEKESREYGLFMTGGSDYHGRYERVKSELLAYPAHESASVLF